MDSLETSQTLPGPFHLWLPGGSRPPNLSKNNILGGISAAKPDVTPPFFLPPTPPRLPKKDNPRRALWLENSRRRDASGEGRWDPASKYIYFCSQHFEKSCFEIVGFRYPFSTDVSCFPREGEDPGGVPALPGPLGARGPLPDTLLVATGDEEATDTPALPEGAPPAPPRPVSPSLYMLRLPPPAGAYIQSEHSYQVGSALLWKRRAEAALDALDKAQRQLQACKRREQRLRLRVGELQRERRAPPEGRRVPKEPPPQGAEPQVLGGADGGQ
nr:THAP domain-containing protein 7 [Anser cygnoides]